MPAPDLSKQTSHGRMYVHPAAHRDPSSPREVPSTTNVMNMMAKPGIAYWGYRQCGEFVAANLETINALAKKDPAAVIDVVKGAPNRRTAESGNTGDLVHEWIDRRVRTHGSEPADQEVMDTSDASARSMWKQFLGIEARYSPEWLLSETTYWSDKWEYAGTLDWMAKIAGKVTLGDTKTGKNIYPEVGMQVAAAANADYAIDDNGEPFHLPLPEKFAVLHIRPRYARLSPLDGIPECFRSFLGLRAAFEWKVTHSEQVIQYAPKIQAQ